MKIWVRPPRDLHPLQREGLKLLSHLPRGDHIAVHWGMAMAVYPFWGAVATHVGRLLRLRQPQPARYSAVCGSTMVNATRSPGQHDGCYGASLIGGS